MEHCLFLILFFQVSLCCIATIQLHVYKYTREHNQLIMTISVTNEYTSLYKSLTLYFRKGDILLCVRNEWRQGRTAILTQVLPRPYQHFFRILAWVAQPWVTEGRKALSLQAGSHAGILSPPVSNRTGTWLYYFLMSTCFRCSSAYLYRCISWLTARSRVNI